MWSRRMVLLCGVCEPAAHVPVKCTTVCMYTWLHMIVHMVNHVVKRKTVNKPSEPDHVLTVGILDHAGTL
jgi:hypothetical protein